MQVASFVYHQEQKSEHFCPLHLGIRVLDTQHSQAQDGRKLYFQRDVTEQDQLQ